MAAAELKSLDNRFGHLKQYQSLVSQAIMDAIGAELYNYRNFYYAQEKSSQLNSVDQKKKDNKRRRLSDSGIEESLNLSGTQTQFKNNDSSPSRRRFSKMIRREDALKQLAMLQDDINLPTSFQENKMKADYLLFKEAQVNYM